MQGSTTARQRARTKIIATVGPACRAPEQLAALVEAGVDVFRLNMAHGSLEQHDAVLAAIRAVSQRLGQPLAVLVDLAGPKIRLGEVAGGVVDCLPGVDFRFVRGRTQHERDLTCTYEPLVDELRAGDSVVLADGTVVMSVVDKASDSVRCRVVQAGRLRSRQGINLPGVKLSAPAMDDADRRHAIWAAENGIDFVGLSFVRRAADVAELRQLLRDRGSAARVVAKIEKQEAIDAFEAIVIEADAVMVARGDLGVEIDVAQVPVVQKRIVAECNEHQKPVIVATQMLDSMQHSQRPTRAEATDVANAILDGADACMLSGETAIGEYPREAVETMNRIALATEEFFRHGAPQPPGNFRADGLKEVTAAIVYGAGCVAAELDARLMIVASHSGATALAMSKQRNYVPTVGVSDVPEVVRRMCLFWGVIPLADVPTGNSQEMFDRVMTWACTDGTLESGDYVVMVAGTRIGEIAHNQIVVDRVP